MKITEWFWNNHSLKLLQDCNDKIRESIYTLFLYASLYVHYFYMPLLCFWDENVVVSLCLKGMTDTFPYSSDFFHPKFSLLYPVSAPICNSIKSRYNVLLWIIVTGIFYALLCEFSPSDIVSYAVFEFCTWFNDIKWCREIYMLCSLSNELEAWRHPICTGADAFSGHTWPITCEP